MYGGNAEQMFGNSCLSSLACKDLEIKINGFCRDLEVNLQPYNSFTSFGNKNLMVVLFNIFAYFFNSKFWETCSLKN